jgi:hypothetical protein
VVGKEDGYGDLYDIGRPKGFVNHVGILGASGCKEKAGIDKSISLAL